MRSARINSAQAPLPTALVDALACLLAVSPLVGHTAQRPSEPVDQQLDRLISKYSKEPIRIPMEIPAEGQAASLNPLMKAASGAVSEAESVCVSNGGIAMTSRIIKGGSNRFVPSVKCAKGDEVLWYLDVEECKVSFPKEYAGDELYADVNLSLRRLMPADAPQSPVLHWMGVHKPDGDNATPIVHPGPGLQFGFRYSWRFKPQTFKRLELVWQSVASGVAGPDSKVPHVEFRREHELHDGCVDPRSCNATWIFETPQEWTPGIWRLSLVADGAVILSTVFAVSKP